MSDYSVDGNNPSVLAWRVRELARQVADLVTWRRDVDGERTELRLEAKGLAEEMQELKGAVDALRKTLLGFSLTVAVAAVGFALTVLSSSGKL